jgi:hypothetical protein
MTLSEAQVSRHPADGVRSQPLAPGFRFCRRSPSRRAVLLTPVVCLGAFRCGVLRGSPRGLLPEFTLAFPDPLSSRPPRFNFSRLAPASLTLRPANLLTHLYRGLGRKASTPPVTRRRRFSATQAYRILLRWDFHPRVVCALSAHNGFVRWLRSEALKPFGLLHGASVMAFRLGLIT